MSHYTIPREYWDARLSSHFDLSWFDRNIPHLLGWLDAHFFLKRAGVGTPNSKWLIAEKREIH